MAITHADVKVSGNRGYASEWNKNHVIGDQDKPKNDTTLIVAASDSLDTLRADYVCDGIDDQEQINEAMGDLPAHGGRISLLDGTYQTTGTILIPDSAISIVGLGANTVIQTTDNIALIAAIAKADLMISSLKLIGRNVLSVAQNGIYLLSCNTSRIMDIWAEDQGGSAIRLHGCTDVKITDCFADGNLATGMEVNSSTRCVLLNCVSDNNGANFYGFGLVDAQYCKLLACFADNNRDGINLVATAGHNVISACSLTSNTRDGVRINVGCNRNNVINNMVVGNTVTQVNDLGANNDVAHNQVL